MRYRIQFTARKDDAFNWDINESFESNELLEIIFKFQMMITREFKKIIEESKRIEYNDDIPF